MLLTQDLDFDNPLDLNSDIEVTLYIAIACLLLDCI